MADTINKQGLFGSNIPGLLDEGIASLYDRDALVGLENQYGNTYEVGNSATGPLSDARHMAAMNNLSNTLSPMNNRVGNFIGDTLAFGAGLINEVPALGRGFNKQNLGEIAEDIAANYAGSFGTPNTATAQGIYEDVFSRAAPQTVRGGPFANYGTAQAAEVTPTKSIGDIIMEATTSVPQMSIEDQIQANIDRIQSTPGFEGYVPSGTPTQVNRPNMRDVAGDINLNMTDLGNPYNDPRVVSEEQGLSGFPGLGQVDSGFQNVLDAREARMNEIAMQQNPDYGQFFDAAPVNEKKGIDLNDVFGGIASLYTGPYEKAVKLAAMANNMRTGKLNQVLGKVRGIPASLNKKMRGVNPITGKANTQREYEQARTERQQQNRTDKMIDRIASGKRTRSDPRDAGTTAKQKADISAAIQDAARTGNPVGDRDSGPSKIVCTMMNERYGFGSFRNKIWMKFHENHGPEYQKGYHTIFLPLVKIAKGEGKLNTAVRKVLEHMGRHVTADMFKIMKGKKRDTLGRIYRAVFEPTCRLIGKIKSALGRG